MIPLAVIRPQPGCDATVAAARAMGLDAHAFPMFAVAPVAWQPPAAHTVDALLLGSANALRHGGAALARYRGKPAYAVGESTAAAARTAGFDVAACGTGGLQGVLDRVRPGHRRLLRLAGQERVALEPPAGVAIEERVVYASKPLAMPDGLRALLREPVLVLLHSAEAARHLAGACAAGGIDRAGIALAALGPRIAAAAGDGWAACRSAAEATDGALLALALEMCQDRRGAGKTGGA